MQAWPQVNGTVQVSHFFHYQNQLELLNQVNLILENHKLTVVLLQFFSTSSSMHGVFRLSSAFSVFSLSLEGELTSEFGPEP